MSSIIDNVDEAIQNAEDKETASVRESFGRLVGWAKKFANSERPAAEKTFVFEKLAPIFGDPAFTAQAVDRLVRGSSVATPEQGVAALPGGNAPAEASSELPRLRARNALLERNQQAILAVLANFGLGTISSNDQIDVAQAQAVIEQNINQRLDAWRSSDYSVAKADVKRELDAVIAKVTDAATKATEADGKSDGHLDSKLFGGNNVSKDDVKKATEAAKTAAEAAKTATEAAKTALGL